MNTYIYHLVRICIEGSGQNKAVKSIQSFSFIFMQIYRRANHKLELMKTVIDSGHFAGDDEFVVGVCVFLIVYFVFCDCE